MAQITISKSNIEKQKGVVILPLKQYRDLIRGSVPIYYLNGKDAEALDKLVEGGLKEYRSGKTIKAGSLKEALKKHGGRRKN